MKALLIDPEKQSLENIDIIPRLHFIRQAIGCDSICGLNVGFLSNQGYCDDDGLSKVAAGDAYTLFPRQGGPVVGKVLVFGPPSPDGEETSFLGSTHVFARVLKFGRFS